MPRVGGDEGGAPVRRLRLRVIACEALARPVSLCAARSPHIVDLALLRLGLHDTPELLRQQIQASIDEADLADPPYDAVVLAYGLCGGASAGISAGKIRLVVPRAHDCVTVLLGGRDRYEREFAAHPGTYWYTTDVLERGELGEGTAQPGGPHLGAATEAEEHAAHAAYAARFGGDNASYLMEALGGWRSGYDRAALIDMGLGDVSDAEARVRREAERNGWGFERLAGDTALIARLLDGDWSTDFLVLEPGQRLAMSYDESIVRAAGRDAHANTGHLTDPPPVLDAGGKAERRPGRG